METSFELKSSVMFYTTVAPHSASSGGPRPTIWQVHVQTFTKFYQYPPFLSLHLARSFETSKYGSQWAWLGWTIPDT